MITFYGLKHCSTCKKAEKWFEEEGIEIGEYIDIRENPPGKDLILEALVEAGDKPRKVLNTSGQVYRESGLKDKIDHMTLEELAELLSQEGMLVKRPFITDGQKISVGGKPTDLSQVWKAEA